jgi:hypothetical protein
LNMALSEDQRPSPPSFDARAAIVNRTHRVVRERAAAMQARKRSVRDLIIPFLICSALLLLIANSVWSIAEEGLTEWESGVWKRITELGSDTGSSISILLVWFLPLSVITAAIILLRRNRGSNRDDEVQR